MHAAPASLEHPASGAANASAARSAPRRAAGRLGHRARRLRLLAAKFRRVSLLLLKHQSSSCRASLQASWRRAIRPSPKVYGVRLYLSGTCNFSKSLNFSHSRRIRVLFDVADRRSSPLRLPVPRESARQVTAGNWSIRKPRISRPLGKSRTPSQPTSPTVSYPPSPLSRPRLGLRRPSTRPSSTSLRSCDRPRADGFARPWCVTNRRQASSFPRNYRLSGCDPMRPGSLWPASRLTDSYALPDAFAFGQQARQRRKAPSVGPQYDQQGQGASAKSRAVSSAFAMRVDARGCAWMRRGQRLGKPATEQ